MKVTGARFSSGTDVNAFQFLIYFFELTYKEYLSRFGGALKLFIILFASVILAPIVVSTYVALHVVNNVSNSLKSKVDKLNVDKLKPVPVDLKKLRRRRRSC